MANFVLLVDSDADRRDRFMQKVQSELHPVSDLEGQACSQGDFSCAWAASSRMPSQHFRDSSGASIVFGEMISPDSPERIPASDLHRYWSVSAPREAPLFDGFHAAFRWDQNDALLAGADHLGLFPLYYYADDSLLLLGSSPEGFRHHPRFRLEVSPEGLTGILLLGHLFDHQALLQGVRRLPAGCLLHWRKGVGAREIQRESLPFSFRYLDLPFSDDVTIMIQTTEQAIRRHAPAAGRPTGVLLSGGLDSRMLAGYLKEEHARLAALTFGSPSDIEMQCALPVARALNLEHHCQEVPLEHLAEAARMHARWEHLSSGMNTAFHWTLLPALRRMPPWLVLGYVIDIVMGALSFPYSIDPRERSFTFDRFLPSINGWGISPDLLKRLYRKDAFQRTVDERLNRIRNAYEGYSSHEYQRVWGFNIENRARFHVGEALWPFSFAACPILPVLDRSFIEAMLGMPPAALFNRLGQKELMIRRFPRLASFPLDHNSTDIAPLQPRLRHLIWEGVRRQLGISMGKKLENRYYQRIFDINNPGWTAVRRFAEPARKAVEEFFDLKVLEEVLPLPEVPIRLKNPIADASGLKALLGLMLWAKDHF